MARRIRFLLVFLGLFTFGALAFAEMSDARKLPSATFQRFMVNGTDFKDALSACNFAREGTGWKAVSFDPPNPGGGVNCKYKKAGSSPGELARNRAWEFGWERRFPSNVLFNRIDGKVEATVMDEP